MRSERSYTAAAILSALLAALIPAAAPAQTDTARIVGTITDSSGAVIPGAPVKVINESTGSQRIATTNDKGFYVVTPLPPATYKVAVEMPGFQDAARSSIGLQIGQEKTLNITLQPSGGATEITVSGGDAAVVDTSSARIGVNVGEREVSNLPLNGRQISMLYLLSPGAVNNGSGTFDDLRFSGRANQQNAIRYDGVEGSSIVDASPGNMNGEVSSSFRLQSSVENVQEFRVESSNYPAEYGTGTGGQVSIITKSGSNDFHGSVFDYLRNDALDARNFFDKDNKSKLRLNQFGASVGGPLKKNQTFFFGSYEGVRQRSDIPFVESTPSASAWSRAVPVIAKLRPAFPVGAFPTSNPDLDIAVVTGANVLNEDSESLRLDHSFSEKYRMYARYFRDQGDQLVDQNSTLSKFQVTAVPQNAVWNLQQILTPTIINETKFGYNGNKTRITGIAPSVPGADLSGVTLNLSGSVALGGIAGQAGAASIAIPTGLVRANSATNGKGAPYTNFTFSFIDNLSVIHGDHTMKFGGEVRPVRLRTDRQGGTTYSFQNIDDFLANRPNNIQWLGDVSSPSPWTGKSGFLHLSQTYYVFYGQDEWKIRPTVTLNWGLRYEYYSVLHEAQNKAIVFDMKTGTILPSDTPWYASSKKNFGPRLSISWAPSKLNNKTVFRIGAGYFYGPGQTEDQLQPAESDRIGATVSSGPNLAFPLNTQALAASYDINNPNLGFQLRAYAPGYHIPEQVLSYTASLQQELPGNMVVTVAYVGSQGRNLFLRGVSNRITSVDTNPVTRAAIITREFGNRFAELDFKTSGGTMHYDSMQTTLNRRFSNGLTMGAQWTWSHNIGDTGGSNEARTAANLYDFTADRGNNNFDVRHSFNLTSLYELPVGKGKALGANFGPVANTILGGWQLGGVINSRSGLPIEVSINRPDVVYRDNRTGSYVSKPIVGADGTVFTTAVINVPGGGASRNVRRPDLVPGVNPYLDSDRRFLNPAAFAIPQPGTYGNLARNAFQGPSFAQVDLTLSKKFALREQTNIEFRSEFYNIFNHANFKTPVASLPDSLGTGANQLQPGQPFTSAAAGGNFGVLNSTVSNQIGLGTNRQIQLSLRVNF